MLNIGKLGAGGERYYLDTVASGVEDYYTGSGEAAGYWLGAGAASLGLAGEVAAGPLRAVLGAADPASGERLTRAGHRRVPGFDLTFRAPKSVSVLYGLADAGTARVVREAHDVSVAAALGYLEREAGWSRRGVAGVERVRVSGFVAAGFRHRCSRAGDPLLHTHVLVANLGQAVDDGRWRTLDARQVYRLAKTAGYAYQASLRHELTRRLGLEWGEVRNGCTDLAGVPQRVVRAFSQRRMEIEQRLAGRGESSAKAAQVATLDTRRAKDRDVDAATLRQQWAVRAAALGFTRDDALALLNRTAPRVLDADTAARLMRELAGPTGLSAQASTFTAPDVLQAFLERLPTGARVPDAEALAAAALDPGAGVAVRLLDPQPASGGEVIRRGDGRIVPAGVVARYATPALLTIERRALQEAVARRGDGVAVATAAAVSGALAARPSLSGEQAAMVRRLTTAGAGVEVVVGKAGAGKTFALDATRAAWQASGYRVVGGALAARAAAELEAGAGIDSYTVDGLLADLDRAGPARWLGPRTVVVVDEAAMVGTRKLARLLDHAQAAHAKIVLVGDHHQLPEIDAGGLFRGLAERLNAVELVDNRRQTAAWERGALDHLRHGDTAAAVAAYRAHDRVVAADNADAARDRLVEDWWTASSGTPDPAVVMIAARRSDVEHLNSLARARMHAAGLLHGAQLVTADGTVFQAGDRVMTLRNDRRAGVTNGTRGHILQVDTEHGGVVMRSDDGRDLQLPAGYLDAGWLTHGYAITAHKAQGVTVDRSYVLGSEAIYREWGYVALSRARHHTRLYLVDHRNGDRHADHGVQPRRDDPLLVLAERLQRSHAHRLAHDHGQPDSGPSHGIGMTTEALRQRLLATMPRPVDRQRTLVDDQIRQAQDRIAALREQIGACQDRLAALQRGTGRLTRREDIGGAHRDLQRQRGDLTAWQNRLDHLHTEHAALNAADQQRDQWADDHAPELTAYADAAHGAQAAAARHVTITEVTAPKGTRPDTPTERAHWRQRLHAPAREQTRDDIPSLDIDIA